MSGTVYTPSDRRAQWHGVCSRGASVRSNPTRDLKNWRWRSDREIDEIGTRSRRLAMRVMRS